MKFDKFEDIIAWQKAQELALSVYSIFGNNKDFGFRDQICRSSVSVMNNIAEGFERKSDTKFKHFLFIAKGSCGEIRSMLYLADKPNYLNKLDFEKLTDLSTEISKMISGLIKSLN
jgi:four helix bundle protein